MASTRDGQYRENLEKLRAELFPEVNQKSRERRKGNKNKQTKRGQSAPNVGIDIRRAGYDNILPDRNAPKDPKRRSRKTAVEEERKRREREFEETWTIKEGNCLFHRDLILDSLRSGTNRAPLSSSNSQHRDIFLGIMDARATEIVYHSDSDSSGFAKCKPVRKSGIVILEKSRQIDDRLIPDAFVWEVDNFGYVRMATMRKHAVVERTGRRISYSSELIATVTAEGIISGGNQEQSKMRLSSSGHRSISQFCNIICLVGYRSQDGSPSVNVPESSGNKKGAKHVKVWKFDRTIPRVVAVNTSSGSDSGSSKEFSGYSHQFTVSSHYRNQACGPNYSERKRVRVRGHVRGQAGTVLDDRPIIYRFK